MSDVVKKSVTRKLYQCMKCNVDPYVGQKFRVVGHLMKTHLNLTEVPYYCTLCLFRCQEWNELTKHVEHFKPHRIQRDQVMEYGSWTGDDKFFKRNANPIKIEERVHFRKLSQEEAAKRAPANRQQTVMNQESTKVLPPAVRIPVSVPLPEPATTPPCTPVPSPLSTPVRRILRKEAEDEQKDMEILTKTQESKTDQQKHPSPDWDMVPVNSDTTTKAKPKSSASSKSSSSSSKSSSCYSVPFSAFTKSLKEHSELVKAQNEKVIKEMQGLIKEVSTLKEQVKGLRSVIRTQGDEIRNQAKEIKRLSEPPSFRVPSSVKRVSRSRTPRKFVRGNIKKD